MKKGIAIIMLLTLLLCLLTCCGKDSDKDKADNTDETEMYEQMSFTEDNIVKYVSLSEYKELKISLSEGQSKGDAVMERVVSDSLVKEYPSEQVNYYLSQERAKYRYLAQREGKSYEELLSLIGVTEEGMLKEAEELTKRDLVFYALVFAEKIEISDSEKTVNFDKYVKKYVDDYGYTESYVRENLSEQIFESMLYDKTIERLIGLNSFG